MSSSVPSPSTVLEGVDQLAPPGTPLTTPEVAAEFDCTDRTVYNRLDALVEDGVLETKKVGARGRVWWRPLREHGGSEPEATAEGDDCDRVRDRLRDREERLAAELDATKQLQEISTRLIQKDDIDTLYDEILDAVVTVMDADFARLQLRDPDRGDLHLLAHSGFDETTALWDRVTPESNGPCSVALETGQRVVVPDVETCEFMAGTEDRETLLEAGIRAVQSTPLVSRSGDVVGMLSTHWETPHEPSERDLRSIDVIARQATDLIGQQQAKKALHESEERYRELFESMSEGFCVIERVDAAPGEPVDFRYVEANPAFADHSGIDDVVGRTLRDVIPDEAVDWVEIYNAVVQTGEAERFERELVSEGRTLELYAFPVGDGSTGRVGVTFRDVTDRKRRIDGLREAHTQLRTATSAGSVGLWTWEVREDTLTADEFVAESYGLDPETTAAGASIERFFERVHEDDRERVRTRVERAIEDTGVLDTEYRVRDAEGEVMWLVLRGEVECDENGEAIRMYGAISDITERKEAEGALKRANDGLERLTAVSRELMDASTQDITDRAAELTRSVLDVEHTALWRYDEATGEFSRHAHRTAPELDVDAIRYPDGFSERVWRSFIHDETAVENDLPAPDDGEGTRATLRSYTLVPLPGHGVVCAGSTRAGTFDEQTIDLANTLGATLETAWNRAADERRLARQNEELARLDRLNGLIREIDTALVQADSRAAIERAVCDRLAASDQYAFVWIGDRDPATETITPREWAGVDTGYVDDLSIPTDGTSSERNPVAAAARTRDTQVVADIATETRFTPLREATLEQGARSCLAVPLVYEESLYGVLTVYADHSQPDERDHAVLAELGRTIAHAIAAVETRETLRTDRVVELTLQCREANTPLCRLARQAECEIEFEGFVRQSDDELDVFFTASGVPAEELATASEQVRAITDLLRLTDQADTALFRARVAEPALAARIVEQDAVVRTLTIENGAATAVVDVPHVATVREFIERLQRDAPGLELLARRTRDRPLKTRNTFRAICEGCLTTKQLTALETAYFSGFFESPRLRTGQEVAESLGVSQPTFTTHLRAAQRGVCDLLFAAHAE
ncbi:GAF domain-containing protein [Halalkalicoccus sp. NIPERK01]|uniref:GAF domain-containing protein n=1 Tax=Halalkalicoccus sp. NIPERK01 TaxID=3053469 RepID=UPI00256EEFAC|nr:GAF domain-containing protein [Halalkalicoccus sp. NIPERK01]MDL5360818.1 bacterio-opsin activator domain-containing protein [Halalkalicoccus sp. NIPERK01]